jgi:hypothetical protein
MAEEPEEEQQQPIPPTDRDRRIVARFLDLLAAGFVALAVAVGFEEQYGRASAAFICGIIVFLCGVYWDRVRAIIGPTLAGSIYRVASSAVSWLAVLFIIFCYIAAPSFISSLSKLSQSSPSLISDGNQFERNVKSKTEIKIPTWLILRFDPASHEPTIKSTSNIHWWWWNPTEQPSLITLPGLSTTTVLFLSLDEPQNLDNILVKAEYDLPRYEIVKKIDRRIVVIWIHGVLSGDLYIEIQK